MGVGEGMREESEKVCVTTRTLEHAIDIHAAHACPGARADRHGSHGNGTGHKRCRDGTGGPEPWTGLQQGRGDGLDW